MKGGNPMNKASSILARVGFVLLILGACFTLTAAILYYLIPAVQQSMLREDPWPMVIQYVGVEAAVLAYGSYLIGLIITCVTGAVLSGIGNSILKKEEHSMKGAILLIVAGAITNMVPLILAGIFHLILRKMAQQKPDVVSEQ